LTQLTKVIRPEPRGELRLAYETNLKYGVTAFANVRQQAEMLENDVRQKVGFVDDHDGPATLGRMPREASFEPPSSLRLRPLNAPK
jgi:hypothetical protein